MDSARVRELSRNSDLPPPFSKPEQPPPDPHRLAAWLAERKVHSIMPAIIDVDGHPRGPTVGIGELLGICAHRPSLEGGPGGQSTDGSSIEGGYGEINDSDTRMIIDPKSVRLLPGFDGMAIGFGNAVKANPRKPLEPRRNPGCFRTTLQEKLEYARSEHGIEMLGGYETEFFLYPSDTQLQAPYFAGIPSKGNYQQGPHRNPDHDALMLMLRFLAQDGLHVTVAHTEVSHRQVEINTAAADLVRAAEDFMVLRMGLPRIAELLGYTVDFSAKPVGHWNGSGEHTHLSARFIEDGSNAFFNSDGTLTEFGGYFVGGISECVWPLVYLGNLFEECYARISVPGYEAPNRYGWGWGNRTVNRFTGAGRASYHLEFRPPSPSGTHAFALLTALISAGMYGVENRIKPPKLVKFNAYTNPGKLPKLPRSLDEARHAFSQCQIMGWAFTPEQFDALSKRAA